MRFSIVIPVYNLEGYIGELIDSIISQTFKDYEVLLINDGSKDNSRSEMEKHINKDKRFVIIDQVNSGPGIARNNGLKKAKGEYVLFFDGDDLISKNNALEELDKLADENLDILFYPIQRMSNEDKVIHDSKNEYETTFADCDTFEKILERMLVCGMIMSSPCEQLFKRDFLVNNNLYFPEGIFSEDIEWIIRIMLAKPLMKFSNFQFYVYRWNRPNSTCNTLEISYGRLKPIIGFINYYYDLLINDNNSFSNLILGYLAYHWCVEISNVSKLKKKEERVDGFKTLMHSKKLLKYTYMKKVKLFSFVSHVIGAQNAAYLGAFRYKIRRQRI